jgi:hypothetical protein
MLVPDGEGDARSRTPKTLKALAELAEWNGQRKGTFGIIATTVRRGARRHPIKLIVMTDQVWRRLNRDETVKIEAV